MSGPLVLILTHQADHFTVDRVAAALARRGAEPVRLDTDQFPGHVRIAARLGDGQDHFTLEAGSRTLDTAEVRAVWARRLWPAALDPALDPRFVDACRRESRAALEGFLDGCRAARWINPLAAERSAGDKLLQLRLAREHGLAVPRTLLTNDPEAVRAFRSGIEGGIVAKMLTAFTTGMEAGDFVYTSTVGDDDLRALEGLRHSPMLFQERVPKARELRVVMVGGRLFTGAVDASGSAAGAVDWRRADPAACRWQRDTVPAPVADALRALRSALGIEYGAADLVLTPQGEYVFLEMNPAGEWGMLERDLDYEISGALADALCAPWRTTG